MVKYWVFNMEFAKLIELVHVFICIIWLCQLGRSRLLLWIIWFFCIFASANSGIGLCFSFGTLNSINTSRIFVFIPSPILQEPLFINLTCFRKFFTGTLYQLFGDSWAQTCLRQMNQESSVPWDCPQSFRSAFKSLIIFYTCPRFISPWLWAWSIFSSECQGMGWEPQWPAAAVNAPSLLQARSAGLV